MSHSVIITLDHIKMHTAVCDSLIDECNELKNIQWTDKTIIDNLINDIENVQKELLSQVNQASSSTHQIQAILSSITKKASNLKYNLNLKDQLVNSMQLSEFNIDKAIAQYGSMAINVVEKLDKQGVEINDKTFAQTLEQIRSDELLEEQLEAFHHNCLKQINSSDLSEEIKQELSKTVRKINQVQEISDLPAYIESKRQEYNTTKILAKDIMESLTKLQFSKDKGSKWKMNDENELVLELSFTNKTNNTIKILFYSSGKFKYKLGNYVGHACEATSEKLWKDLQDKGYMIKDKRIKRDIDGSKPMFMNTKNNEGDK